jgi:hypothetical protein
VKREIGAAKRKTSDEGTLEPTFPLIFLQLLGPATGLSRKFLLYLTTARHFKSYFYSTHNKKIPGARQQFSAREHFSYCAAAHARSLEGTLLRANEEKIF